MNLRGIFTKIVFLLWKTLGRCMLLALLIHFFPSNLEAQLKNSKLDSARLFGDVRVLIDMPESLREQQETVLILYALPNGNSAEWTMGKRTGPGDDWHFDIQHIRAQTAFIRAIDKKANYVVAYLENDQRSWPAWKQRHANYRELVPIIIQTVKGKVPGKKVSLHLNGHSGGGSFIFMYLAAVDSIPREVKRISFLDSNYGFEAGYFSKLSQWLARDNAFLHVFAYNDSVALLNGKPFVSATGGTWHRSHMMLEMFRGLMPFRKKETDSLITYRTKRKNVSFFLKKNLNRGIYHTQQVELNGFIHSVFAGTRFEEKKYKYYSVRAYEKYIE